MAPRALLLAVSLLLLACWPAAGSAAPCRIDGLAEPAAQWQASLASEPQLAAAVTPQALLGLLADWGGPCQLRAEGAAVAVGEACTNAQVRRRCGRCAAADASYCACPAPTNSPCLPLPNPQDPQQRVVLVDAAFPCIDAGGDASVAAGQVAVEVTLSPSAL